VAFHATRKYQRSIKAIERRLQNMMFSNHLLQLMLLLSLAVTRSKSKLDSMLFGGSMFLLLVVQTAHVDGGILPTDFSIRHTLVGPELVWTASDKSQVRMGASKFEFRFSDGMIFGYPIENLTDSTLVLPMTANHQSLLATMSEDLEVWYSEKRIDRNAPFRSERPNIFSAAAMKSTAPPTPTIDVNPAARGNYTTNRLSYNLAPTVTYSLFPFGIEILAEVTYPEPLPSGTQCPFVLFLHGRHTTCYQGGPNGFYSGDWPCPSGWSPIPSHLGYQYITDILASQGYIAVSISANGINGQDHNAPDGGAEVRSLLIRRHLSLWARWNTVGGDPWRGKFRGKVDLNNVVLVGHSRGGEGVNRAAIDASSSSPYKIVGLVSYGPTAFGSQVTPDVHSVTILPGKHLIRGNVFNHELQLIQIQHFFNV
jgi:hypothetical protein